MKTILVLSAGILFDGNYSEFNFPPELVQRTL